jgi:hypothetical protein
VHDDGDTRLAVVVCDLIGLSNYRVRKIRSRIRSVPPDCVIIATTHVHSGPDTLGLWGKTFGQSGIDPLYMSRLEDRIVAAVETAAGALRPARTMASAVEVPDGLVHNSRENVQDRRLTALRWVDEQGATIASAVHYGGHPEVNKAKSITSDFVHYVREAAEARYGGVCLFLNGALGGMVTPQVKEHSLAEMVRVGEGVGRAAVDALSAGRETAGGPLRVDRAAVRLPLENQTFRLLAAARSLDVDPALPAGVESMETEVWRIDLGPVCIVTIPGEVLPKPALALRARIPGPFPLVLAMAHDELGYLLDPADFDRELYRYEKSMSVGRRTWPMLEEAALRLLAKPAGSP